MEIKEIVSYYLNETSNTIEITFRTIHDSDDEIRNDQIELDECTNFGYKFWGSANDNFLFGDDDYSDEELFEDTNDEIDEQEIISFLNEYYLVHPDRLPSTELF